MPLLRQGILEALALYPKDLDPAGGSLRVLDGKGNKARTAPLPGDAAEAVDRWLDCRKRLGSWASTHSSARSRASRCGTPTFGRSAIAEASAKTAQLAAEP